MNTFNVFIPVESNITLNFLAAIISTSPGDVVLIGTKGYYRPMVCHGTYPFLVLTNTCQIIVLIGSKSVLTGLPGEVFSTKYGVPYFVNETLSILTSSVGWNVNPFTGDVVTLSHVAPKVGCCIPPSMLLKANVSPVLRRPATNISTW